MTSESITTKKGAKMKWLRRLFESVPPEEMEGIHLDHSVPQWKVSKTKYAAGFLRALIDLLPDGCILYLEDSHPSGELELFLDERSVPEVSHVHMNTSWPRPKVFHIPATAENLNDLAEIAEHCAGPEIATHIHVYKEDQVLIQWPDAFSDPLYVSKEIPEEAVKRFCDRLGVRYGKSTAGG